MSDSCPYIPPGILKEAGQPGHNEHGVPLHACNGYRHDEHYWAWVKAQRLAKDSA